ncbi:hypothetical protein D3C76_97360 [compost metagenome]
MNPAKVWFMWLLWLGTGKSICKTQKQLHPHSRVGCFFSFGFTMRDALAKKAVMQAGNRMRKSPFRFPPESSECALIASSHFPGCLSGCPMRSNSPRWLSGCSLGCSSECSMRSNSPHWLSGLSGALFGVLYALQFPSLAFGALWDALRSALCAPIPLVGFRGAPNYVLGGTGQANCCKSAGFTKKSTNSDEKPAKVQFFTQIEPKHVTEPEKRCTFA